MEYEKCCIIVQLPYPTVKHIFLNLVLVDLLLLTFDICRAFPAPSELILALKKVVVNITINMTYGLNHDEIGSFVGTGFIVDGKRGIVATNSHLVGTSPQQVHITFENGERCEARVLHVDDWHDFAFYQLSMEEVDWELPQATLGSSFHLKEQQPAFLIGNNDSEEYSVKFGVITNLVINRGERHSDAFQTSFDRTGGSSGSPVFDSAGVVVGMHMRGTNTTSIEIRIEYIKDALDQIQYSLENNKLPLVKRGDIGIELDLLRISDALKHYSFPQYLVDQLKSTFSNDIKHVLTLERTVPHGQVASILKPGDILWSVNGNIIGKNIYLFDKLIDESNHKNVDLVVYRNGNRLEVNLPVTDTDHYKLKKFALFAGGVFHEITPAMRSTFSIYGPGIFMSQVSPGSSFSGLGDGSSKRPTSYVVVIEEICGLPTHSLADFINVVSKLGEKKHIYVLSRNLRNFSSALNATAITLDLKFEPLRVFEWNPKSLEWTESIKKSTSTPTSATDEPSLVTSINTILNDFNMI